MARETLPSGYDFAWSGLSLEEVTSGSQALYLFALSIVLVYLVLAAQYESWVLPLIILMGVPLAVLGALGAQDGLRRLRNGRISLTRPPHRFVERDPLNGRRRLRFRQRQRHSGECGHHGHNPRDPGERPASHAPDERGATHWHSLPLRLTRA